MPQANKSALFPAVWETRRETQSWCLRETRRPGSSAVCKRRRAQAGAVPLQVLHLAPQSATYRYTIQFHLKSPDLFSAKISAGFLLLLLKGQFHSFVVRQCWVIKGDHVSKLVFLRTCQNELFPSWLFFLSVWMFSRFA